MPTLLHDLFQRSRIEHPDRVAVDVPAGPGRPLRTRTYAELDRDGDALRAHLQRFVQQPDSIVAIALAKPSTDVHATQLGVLRAGAAFVCLDLSVPDDYLRHVVEDAAPAAFVTDTDTVPRLVGLGVDPGRIVDVAMVRRQPRDGAVLWPMPPWLAPESLAYVIYTSGTTGRPKGVMVEHRSIVHLLEAEAAYFELGVSDRCVQVSSNAYDSAIEEAWLPFTVGAAVVVADESVVRMGPDLVGWLREQGITVLMPTPTMLRATGCVDPARELPELRVVYTGGEPITADLVDLWGVGKRLENGYGPTECTVTVTRARLQPGREVTIGREIGRSRAHVLAIGGLDEVDGPGELCFSGPCLARGYLGLQALTAQRFVDHPTWGRIYRTGDLAERGADGDLRYLGRIDSQVKVRGHRIELAAIEATLASVPGVQEAACKVQGGVGRESISAYIVRSRVDGVEPAHRPNELPDGGGGDEAGIVPLFGDGIGDALRARLRDTLPAHMIPERFAVVERLPLSVGGKLDRSALPDLGAVPDDARAVDAEARMPEPGLEEALAAAFGAVLGVGVVARDADFFDLGGNSLRAAECVTALRRVAGGGGRMDCSAVTVRDVYECRTVAALAVRLAGRGGASTTRETGDGSAPWYEAPDVQPVLVTCLQLGVLAVGLVVASVVGWAILFGLLPVLAAQFDVLGFVFVFPVLWASAVTAYSFVTLFVALAAKWLLIGRYRPCRIKAWTVGSVRHWLVARLVGLFPWGMLQGTVFYSAALRAFGARIGRRVHIHRGVDLSGGGFDLLEIGDDATLAQDASLGVASWKDGHMHLAPVRVGARAVVDIRAGLDGGASLGDDAHLMPLSSVAAGVHVPARERWDGVPAARVGVVDEAPEVDGGARMDPALHGVVMIAVSEALGLAFGAPWVLAVLVLFAVTGFEPEEFIEAFLSPTDVPWLALGYIASAAVGLCTSMLVGALFLRWARPVQAGTISRWSLSYVRIWVRTGILERAGSWLSGSLYWRWWLRLAGMRIGANTEISTITDVLVERVGIGEQTFFADGVYLGGPKIRAGVVEVADTVVGPESFVGNHAVIPSGTTLAPGILVGISTVADGARMPAGTSWFGHPAFELPQREVVACDRSLTHEPTSGLYLQRLCWESARVVIPAIVTAAIVLWIEVVSRYGVVAAPLVTVGTGLLLMGFVLATKWILLGRVRPGTHGLWSGWCCRWDFLYMVWGMLARGALAPLSGTLLLPWYLRAMGMRVGRRVVLVGSFEQVVDPDMLTIEDGATIDPLFQAHTFEDRVLKIGPVHIGQCATVRRGVVLLYGADVGADVTVEPHSVVMKNERLTDGARYAGVPVVPRPAG